MDRLVCDHYNLSYLEVREELTWFEYTVLLLHSLDAEEQRDYTLATMMAIGFHNPKHIKKLWRDHKRSTVRRGGNVAESIATFALQHSGGQIQATGQVESFANATGRPIAYRLSDGQIVDKDGKPVIRTPETIVVPYKK